MPTGALFWLLAFGNASRVLLLVIGLLGLARYRLLPTGLRYLVGLLWFGLCMEVAAYLLQSLKIGNLILVPLDAMGEVWLLSLVYAQALQSTSFTRMRPWVAGTFVLCTGLSVGLNFELTRFKPGVQVLESLLILGMTGLYFRKILNELQVPNLARDPMFWVSAGLVLYSVSKLLIALFSNFMLGHYSQELNLWVWAINALLTVVLYLCYLRALWLSPQK